MHIDLALFCFNNRHAIKELQKKGKEGKNNFFFASSVEVPHHFQLKGEEKKKPFYNMHGSKELNLHHHLVLFCLDDLLQIIDSCTKFKKKKIQT